jgi:hypothetical protein
MPTNFQTWLLLNIFQDLTERILTFNKLFDHSTITQAEKIL